VDPSIRVRPVETSSKPLLASRSCGDDSTRLLRQWRGGRVGAELTAAAWRQGRALAWRWQRETSVGHGPVTGVEEQGEVAGVGDKGEGAEER
jgi:hypothetical protein